MLSFSIGTTPTSYANYILAGTYQVNNNPTYESYTDANTVEHRVLLRANKVSGTFDMKFRTPAQYASFVNYITANRNASSGALYILLSVNNTNTVYAGWFYLTFEPVRNRDGKLQEYMETFTVTIEEA